MFRKLARSASRIENLNIPLPTFIAGDWFTIKDRGDVASVRIDRDCRKDELLQTFGRVVIDGEEYEVIGVESWALETIREGSSIGLLVKGGRRAQRRSGDV